VTHLATSRPTKEISVKRITRLVMGLTAAATCLPMVTGLPASAATASSPISDVITFGDSWSSANYVFGTSPGGAWPQILAQKLGSTQLADTAGGENYARGGAFVEPIEPYSTSQSPTPVSEQVDAYVAKHRTFDSDDLVTVWAGGNDLFAYSGSNDADTTTFCQGAHTPAELNALTADMSTITATEVAGVKRLLSLGAQKVAILDMVDLGITANDPCLTPAGNSVVGAMAKVHNLALYNDLSEAGLLNDDRVDFIQISRLFDAVAKNPGNYGFTVVDGDPCPGFNPCGPETWPVPNADRTYVFGQYGHFNAATRELIAQSVYDSVTAKWSANAGTVSIAGKVAVGRKVTANVGPWTPAATLRYAWFANGKAIAGATTPALTVPASAAGKTLTVVVTGSRPGQADTAVTSAGVKVAKGTFAAPTPRINGKAKVGKTLKVSTGSWTPSAARTYKWYANGKAISGATKSSLKLTRSLKGKKVKVRVTGKRVGYSTLHLTSRSTTKVKK
jgi:phospholipase/lecithinase/hemolysin